MAAVSNKMMVADMRSSGRLWAFAFRDGVAAPIAEEAVGTRDADWVWSHYTLSDQRSRTYVERAEGFPGPVRECLLGHETRVQIHVEGAWTYGVLPDFEHELEGDATSACRLNFAFDAHHLITTRRHALHVVDVLRREIERGAATCPHPPTPRPYTCRALWTQPSGIWPR